MWRFVLLGRPLTMNQVYGKKHIYERASIIKRIREEAFYISAGAGIPVHLDRPIVCSSQCYYPNRQGLTDVGAEIPTLKGIVDSLVDRKYIPNDTSEWVKELRLLVPVVSKEKVVLEGLKEAFIPPGVVITVALWHGTTDI